MAGSNELNLRLTAEDDASKTIDKVVGKAEDATAKPYDIDLRLEPGNDITKTLDRLGTDIEETVAKVKKLGQTQVTFRANTDQLDAIQKKLGNVIADVKKVDAQTVDITVKSDDLDTAAKRLQGTHDNVERLGKSASSSKNALSNMIGNSVQDLGQLGGVAGSTGVAIGQMAEFMADAVFEGEALGAVIGSFAKIILPIAALTIAIQLLGKASENVKTDVDAIVTGFGQGTDAVNAYADALNNSSRNVFDFGNNLMALKFTLGLGEFDNAAHAVEVFGDVLKKSAPAAANLLNELETGNHPGLKLTSDQLQQMSRDIAATIQSQAAGASATKKYDQAVKDSQTLLEHGLAIRQHDGESIDSFMGRLREAAVHYEVLDAAASTALDHQSKQWDALTQKLEAQRKALTGLSTAYDALSKTWDEGAQSADAFSSVFTGQEDQFFAIHTAAGAVEDGMGSLGKAVTDAGDDFLKTGGHLTSLSDDGRKVLGTVRQLGGAIGTSLTAELKNAGGSYDSVRSKANDYREQLVSQLTALHLNSDEIQNYVEFLNLTPDQVETTIRLSKQEEARKKIQDLNVDIANLPTDVKTAFTTAYDTGDFTSAYQVLYNTLTNNGKGVTTDVQANTDPATTTLATWVLNAEGKPVLIPVHANTSPLQATLDYLQSHPPTIYVDVQGRTHVNGIMSGTPYFGGGFADVGEAGRERVWLPRGSKVDTAGRTMMADGGGHTTVNINLTVNVPAAANPAEVGGHIVKAISAYERRSGKGWRAA